MQEGFRVDAVLCHHVVVHAHCYGRHVAAQIAACAHLSPLAGAVDNLVQNQGAARDKLAFIQVQTRERVLVVQCFDTSYSGILFRFYLLVYTKRY